MGDAYIAGYLQLAASQQHHRVVGIDHDTFAGGNGACLTRREIDCSDVNRGEALHFGARYPWRREGISATYTDGAAVTGGVHDWGCRRRYLTDSISDAE